MADNNAKCAHPNCNCPPAQDSKYCSAYCEGAAGTIEIGCHCGHAGCGGDINA